jgi:hypothetical protein
MRSPVLVGTKAWECRKVSTREAAVNLFYAGIGFGKSFPAEGAFSRLLDHFKRLDQKSHRAAPLLDKLLTVLGPHNAGDDHFRSPFSRCMQGDCVLSSTTGSIG